MSNYSDLLDHQSMVFDELRNTSYAKAINDAVDKHSVVLDLGAGLGLHGIMAAQAGAKKVYLVEPADILDITRQVITSNHLCKQVECISGRIEEIDLPEKVDVIVSVFTGNFLLTEDLLPSLFFARDKYLTPDGKLIPDRATMNIVPVSAPEYYAKHIDCWNEDHSSNSKARITPGVVLESVRKYAANTLFYGGSDEIEAHFLSEPAELLDMDFMTATNASCQSKVEVSITQDGLCHGWLGWFRIRLGQTWLSTSPTEKQTHWRQVFLPLPRPVSVKQGDKLIFGLNRPEFGEWSWDVEYAGTKQRMSTFLSKPITPAVLAKKSDSYRPHISTQGQVVMEILSRFDGGQSTADIVEFIATAHKTLFPNRKLADRFVKALVERYTT